MSGRRQDTPEISKVAEKADHPGLKHSTAKRQRRDRADDTGAEDFTI
jgi:hypothetical protein